MLRGGLQLNKKTKREGSPARFGMVTNEFVCRTGSTGWYLRFPLGFRVSLGPMARRMPTVVGLVCGYQRAAAAAATAAAATVAASTLAYHRSMEHHRVTLASPPP
ncbi:hypothetical protein M0802_011107 [Mischocyttarus mexicanus]|nr:hypothetical protein M0802_011107 [Mischocyttarus mexicanus]